jgi:hypothetical protein
VFDGGSSGSEEIVIVVYDPKGGFVTGGWIDSQAGSCTHTTLCAGAVGTANFGDGVVSVQLPGMRAWW